MKIFKRRPIRFDILTASTVLLFVTVASIMGYMYYQNTKAVMNLSEHVIRAVRQNVISKVESAVHPLARLVQIGAGLAQKDGFKLPQNQALETYALEILKNNSAVHSVLMADTQGNFLMPTRGPGDTVEVKMIQREKGRSLVCWKKPDKQGRLQPAGPPCPEQYDPRARPWYQGALKSDGTHWTEVYVFFTGKVPGITVSRKILGPDGKLLGVFGMDIELKQLSAFLSTLKVGSSGIAFIVDHKGRIVAFPQLSQAVVHDAQGDHLAFMKESSHGWVAAFAQRLEESGSKKIIFEHQGQDYLATTADMPASFAGDWRIVIIAPENDFIGPLKRTNLETFLFTVGILFVSLWIGALLANSIARPILALIRETKKIKRLELDDDTAISSHIKEIQQMQEAFAAMKASLLSFTKFAPEEVVREVVAKGSEAMLAGEKREVTVLFCDLRGFTGFAERTGAEDVVQILNSHFDVMVRLIAQYNGFVCDFLGDSVFAVFGAPLADERHASDAVNCALQMQLARERLNLETADKGWPALEMGIGINSGQCVVGNMGSQLRIKYGVVGHAVNLGARIESFTVGGQVLVSQSTHQAVNGEFKSNGPFSVEGKGVEEPIPVWEVRSSLKDPTLALPPLVPGLKELDEPLELSLRLVIGKSVKPELYPASITQLSANGAVISTQVELAMFATIQIMFPQPEGQPLHQDARVTAVRESGELIVKFSGISAASIQEVQKTLARLAKVV